MEQENSVQNWRRDLESIASLGSQDEGARRLADLHQARERHLGQFFTPLAVVKLMWRIAEEAFASISGKRKVRLLDNSVGTARMFHFADPASFMLAGVDVHQPVMEATQAAAEAAGFEAKFVSAGMQDVVVNHMDVALLNPPFSIQLESPHLQPLPCTRMGRFGPNSAATSDEYALAQGLACAKVVVAVLPTSMVDQLLMDGDRLFGAADRSRLCAVFELPRSTFSGEGANVSTCVVVFRQAASTSVHREVVVDADRHCLPRLGLELKAEMPKQIFKVRGLVDDEPVITQPVTGDLRVRIVHSGRKIHLKTYCGFAQAKVYNRVLRERISSTDTLRLAKGVRYAGQGILDVECILASEDPLGSIDQLAQLVRDAGCEPSIDVGLVGHVKRQMKRRRRSVAPFGHWVLGSKLGNKVEAVARQTVSFDDGSWTSPVIRKGERTTLERDGDLWRIRKAGHTRLLSSDEALKLFDLPQQDGGWIQVHPPLQQLFPQMAASLRADARRLGLDRFLDWEFQFEDLIEASMKPTGAVVGWKQGLGKARLAAGLILVRRVSHGLVVMPAYLLDEFEKRLKSAGIDESLWQTVRTPEQLKSLRRLNVISYERLRMPVRRQDDSGQPESADRHHEEKHAYASEAQTSGSMRRRSKNTYAKALRHRVGVMVCDEGEVLANPDSDQSRAIACVSAPVVYVLTGTPIPNYPRDLLPISAAAVGDGVVGQPYGWHHPMLSAKNASTMSAAGRGRDAFREEFVSVEWVTHEFEETMTEGAKREVPKVSNLASYRGWLARFVKRRLPDEPDVERFVQIPKPARLVHEVQWTDDHLGYYLQVADDFAEWYRHSTGLKRMSNLMLLLARIGAVERACNVPQMVPNHGPSWHGGLTSKQLAVVERLEAIVERGEKTVVFAKNPEHLAVLQQATRERGINSVMFHGGIDVRRRNKELDDQFRYGPAPILFASTGVMQAGWDLYQATRAIFADRSWSAKVEDQAARRLLRPQQVNPVTLEFFHLEGSVDVYQAQMVLWKAAAADSGLDWAAPMADEVSFLHLDHILEQFVHDLASMKGMKALDLRQLLKEAA